METVKSCNEGMRHRQGTAWSLWLLFLALSLKRLHPTLQIADSLVGRISQEISGSQTLEADTTVPPKFSHNQSCPHSQQAGCCGKPEPHALPHREDGEYGNFLSSQTPSGKGKEGACLEKRHSPDRQFIFETPGRLPKKDC